MYQLFHQLERGLGKTIRIGIIMLTIERIAPYFAVLWLMYVMNTVIAWYPFSSFFEVVGGIGVILCSLMLKKHAVTKGRRNILLFIILYCVWELVKHSSLNVSISLFFTFVPFMYMLFWSATELGNTYGLFRRIVLFFAFGSTVITILSYMGFLSMIPHYELFPKSYLHSNRGDIYNIYIIFPELVVNSSVDLYSRACGFSLEGGHFSIVLGFVYLIDRYFQRKINPIIIICAVLAFSPAFFLIVFFTELMNVRKYVKRIFVALFLSLFVGFFVYSFLPRNIKEMVYIMTYERNVEKISDTYNRTGSLNETLDERTNQLGQTVYKKMNFEEMLYGGKGDKDIIMSDYRGFIVSKGLVSLVLIVIVSLFSLSGAPISLKISLFLTMLMIILHRAWFFYEPFPYLMSFIASSCCFRKRK